MKFESKLVYDACFDTYCKAKVVCKSNGDFLCKKCGKINKNCKIRYFTQLFLLDEYGYIKVSAFDDIMIKLLGLEAQDFNVIMNDNIDIAQSILDSITNKTYTMKITQVENKKIFFNISEIKP